MNFLIDGGDEESYISVRYSDILSIETNNIKFYDPINCRSMHSRRRSIYALSIVRCLLTGYQLNGPLYHIIFIY